MQAKEELVEALEALGELLSARELHFDLVVIGGGALLLHDFVSRATQDLDVVAQVEKNNLRKAKPLPDALVDAVRDVAAALDLPRIPRDDKDWLNAGPAFLFDIGLPEGFMQRTAIHVFGALTVRLASRQDLITLKLWAATDTRRGTRRSVDIDDLRKLGPTQVELDVAVEWCARKDGRPEFENVEAAPVLALLHVGAQGSDA